MQAMNSAILNPLFGLVFGGTTVLCLVLAVTAPFTTDDVARHPAGHRERAVS